MISRTRMCTNFTAFASASLLCGVTAFAQAGGAGTMQQQPQQPNASQTQPGMSPMNQNPDMKGPANGQATPADRMFVKKALEGGMAEVQLGQLALQKSSSDDVKQFAQKMVDDHTKMGDQMKPVAQQIGVKVPDGPSKKDQAIMAKLQGLNGDAFDKAYMKDMVKDHKADLSEFKNEAQNGSSPAVKDAANQGAQVISQHLQMAQQIAQKDGAMASNEMK
jgi:putative membrane protein